MGNRGRLLPLALAGHFIGDWIVQTDWQAANKARPEVRRGTGYETGRRVNYWRSWKANQQHMLGYHLTLATLTALAVHDRRLFVLAVVSWVTHGFIDRRWPVRWLMRHTGSEPFSQTTFGVIAVDQALHLSILCCLAAALDQ